MNLVVGKNNIGNIIAGVMAVFSISAVSIAATPALAATTVVYDATSYGAQVSVGSTVKVGPIAPAILSPCDTQTTGSVSASAASVNDSPLVSTGAVASLASSTLDSASSSSGVASVSLLGGLVSATEIRAVSTSSLNSNGTFSASAAGSEFTGLSVLGLPITVNPAPNTTINLPGIGSVVLNEQISSSSPDRITLTVNMVDIHVTVANLLGFKVGTQIIIASATSQVRAVPGPAVTGGYAYAPTLTTGGLVSVGPLVEVIIPCYGTNGVVKTDTIASTSIPGVLSTGTVTVTGVGTINPKEITSEATTTTQSLNLLSGLLSATAIQATATATTTDGKTFEFIAGSTFGSISVAGHPEITINVAPNTEISIPGVGTLYLNEVVKLKDKVITVPVKLAVTVANTLGLPIGADIQIGQAAAELHSAAIP